jgi:hypothetical protein
VYLQLLRGTGVMALDRRHGGRFDGVLIDGQAVGAQRKTRSIGAYEEELVRIRAAIAYGKANIAGLHVLANGAPVDRDAEVALGHGDGRPGVALRGLPAGAPREGQEGKPGDEHGQQTLRGTHGLGIETTRTGL